MATHTFDVTAFRAGFPAFADSLAYPDAVLQNYWDTATCYMDDTDYGSIKGNCLQLALNTLTAHIAALATNVSKGVKPGLVQSSTIDAVSVTLTPPPLANQFQYWANLTSYGADFLALMQVLTVGGFYFGGLPESSAFRKVGGIF